MAHLYGHSGNDEFDADDIVETDEIAEFQIIDNVDFLIENCQQPPHPTLTTFRRTSIDATRAMPISDTLDRYSVLSTPTTSMESPTIVLSTSAPVAESTSVLVERRPKAGILRLDMSKPRRSSGGSVEFRAQPQLLGEDPSITTGLSLPHQLSVTWAESCDINDTHSKFKPMQEYAEDAELNPVPASDRTSVTEERPSYFLPSPVEVDNCESPIPRNFLTDDYFSNNNNNQIEKSEKDNEDDEEDYSVSVSAIMQRRASIRGYRNKRGSRCSRRGSSPMDQVLDSMEARRRSSVYTSSSDEGTNQESTQEQIFENIRLHKEVIQSVKLQPWPIRKKLKLVRQAKTYVARHEGALQERFAMSRSTKDLFARFKILMAARWRHWKRETSSFLTVLIPWELRIKEIESHFGSGVASYFTFLRWLMWVNIMIAIPLVAFVIGPEYFATKHDETDPRKKMSEHEYKVAGNLFTIWEFEGYLKYSPMFYGYYSSTSGASSLGYKLPLAYFLTSVVVYIYSFVATLRKMAENSRNSKLSSKDDECTFSWKLFTGWDFMIGHAETAHNRIASVVVGFKEALLEEAEKKKDKRNWRIILQRILVNLLVMGLLAASGYTVVLLVNKNEELGRQKNWLSRNAVNVTMTLLSFFLPMIFEALGLFENWHPRQQLRLQLARIMILNMLNLYSLMFSFIYKINSKEKPLQQLKIKNETATSELQHLTELIQNMSTTLSFGNVFGLNAPTTTPTSILLTDESGIPISSTIDSIGSSSSTIDALYTTSAATLLSTLGRLKCYNITVKCSRPSRVSRVPTLATTTLLLMNLTTTMLPTTTEPVSTSTIMTTTPELLTDTTANDDFWANTHLPNTRLIDKLLTTLATRSDDKATRTENFPTETTTTQLPSTYTPSAARVASFFDYYDYFAGMPIELDPEYEYNEEEEKSQTTKRLDLELSLATTKRYNTQRPTKATRKRTAKNPGNLSQVKKRKIKRDIVTNTDQASQTKYMRYGIESTTSDVTNQTNFKMIATSGIDATTQSNLGNAAATENSFTSSYRITGNTIKPTNESNIVDDVDTTTNSPSEFYEHNTKMEEVLAFFQTSTITGVPPPTTTAYHHLSYGDRISTPERPSNSSSDGTEARSRHIDNRTVAATTTTTTKPIIITTIQTTEATTESLADSSTTLGYDSSWSTTPYFIDDDVIEDVGEASLHEVNQINDVIFENCIRTICEEIIPTEVSTSSTTEMEPTTDLVTTASSLTPMERNLRSLSRVKNLLSEIQRNLTSMCWETSLGQELSKVIVFDGIISIVAPLCIDFLRALFVRYVNRNWCWDMEKTFPQYGDFKIAENILTLIYNQGQVWMGIFFSPGLVLINLLKLIIMMYFRSWIVLTCNVPHEVVFKASKSNNFYLTLLLTMLFLCVLPVGYAIVWLRPSWHCGPFSDYNRIAEFITNATRNALPKGLHEPLDYLTSASTVIPLLLLLILIIYYLISLTGALREANQDLRTQLQKEREEERRKMFKVPEAKPTEPPAATLTSRWRKVLEASSPVTPTSQPPDFETEEYKNQARKELISRIMKKALRKGSATSDEDSVLRHGRDDDDTDTEHHDSLPHDEECKDHIFGISRLSQIRRTRKPSLVDIVQIAKSERERMASMNMAAAAAAASAAALTNSRFKIERHERKTRDSQKTKEREKKEEQTKESVVSAENEHDPEENSRIVNERRQSLLRRKREDDEEKRQIALSTKPKDATIEREQQNTEKLASLQARSLLQLQIQPQAKPVKPLPPPRPAAPVKRSETESTYEVVNEKQPIHETTTPPKKSIQEGSFKFKFIKQRLKSPLTTVSSNETDVFKFDLKKMGGKPSETPKTPGAAYLRAQTATSSSNTEALTLPQRVGSFKQVNAEKLANLSRQGRKKIGSFMQLMREAAKKFEMEQLQKEVENGARATSEPTTPTPTPMSSTAPILVAQEPLTTDNLSSTNFKIKEEEGEITTSNTEVLASKHAGGITSVSYSKEITLEKKPKQEIAPIEALEELDKAEPITFPQPSASERIHTSSSDQPIEMRQDSQTSNWSDNIPTITISTTGSDECVAETETKTDS